MGILRDTYERVLDMEKLPYKKMIASVSSSQVDAPPEYNTDEPIRMSEGKVVLVIKTLDGDVEI